MDVVTAVLPAPVNWIVSRSDPKATPLPCLPGWALVNPLVQLPIQANPYARQSISIGQDTFLLVCQDVSFCTHDKALPLEVEEMEAFLARLKYHSGQARLAPHVSGHGRFGIDALDEPSIKGDILKGTPVEYVKLTSIMQDVITRAACGSFEEEVPIHAMLFLEAIEAATYRDFKKAVLFSAFAVELLAQAMIESAHEDLKAGSTPSHRMRFVEIPIAGGGSVRKDPIFEILSDRAKSNAALYLHEASLYVLGYSMQIEDPGLYALNVELRKARNTIAHKGLGGDRLKPHFGDVARALDCARRTFRWFKAKEDYPLPEEIEQAVKVSRGI